MTLKQVDRFFNFTFLALLFTLVVGIPLFFTPYTRSVFEVNKMLLLRLIILTTYLVWFIRTIIFQAVESDTPDENTVRILGYTWKKTGLELPMALWFLVNVASTLFSQNLRISIFGCYDRWEGIITLIGYMLLVFMFSKLVSTRKQLFWILGGILGSTFISALYGIFQSHGHDFMHWSQDPTFRVFACINNPVHFCAYVAMVVPLGISMLFYMSHRNEYNNPQKKPYLLLGLVLILGLILLYTYTFNSFSISFIQLTLLLLIGYLLSTQNTETIPNKETILYWSFYAAIIIVLLFTDMLTLNRDQWFGFSAIMLLFFVLAPIPNTIAVIKRLLFVSTGIIFYTQILSFSRATWVGFLLVMPLLFMYLSQQLSLKTQKSFLKDITFTLLGVGSLSLISLFKVQTITTISIISVLKYIGFIATPIYFLISPILNKRHDYPNTKKHSLYFLITLCSIYWIIFVLDIPFLQPYDVILKLAGLVILLHMSRLQAPDVSLLLSRLSIIFSFQCIQHAGQSVVDLMSYLGFCFIFYINVKKTASIKKEAQFWFLLQLISFGFIMCIPTLFLLKESALLFIKDSSFLILFISLCFLVLYGFYLSTILLKHKISTQKLGSAAIIITLLLVISLIVVKTTYSHKEIQDEEGLIAANNIQARTQHYGNQAEKSARISMWKSAIPWVKEFPLLGSGPDTVKYMYPVYRRPEYGKLEGGHNFTPDRLHNEYINTLATRGIIGFIVYYGFLILTWMYITLKGVYTYRHSPLSAVSLSLFIGANIYLGQVLFNFGVVATLVLFYVCVGLSLSMANHSLFYDKTTPNEDVSHE